MAKSICLFKVNRIQLKNKKKNQDKNICHDRYRFDITQKILRNIFVFLKQDRFKILNFKFLFIFRGTCKNTK